jgi:Flp pilus assembly protein TadG
MTRRPALLARFARQTQATASVEFALMVPMLIIMMFGGLEFGHLVWTQHKLADAVRDGARYASRLPVHEVCDGSNSIIAGTAYEDDVKLVTLTGQLATRDALTDPTYWRAVRGWTAAQVIVNVDCEKFTADADPTVPTGIYTDLGAPGPIVTVVATNVAYPSLYNGFAGISGAIRLSARSNAAVIGL